MKINYLSLLLLTTCVVRSECKTDLIVYKPLLPRLDDPRSTHIPGNGGRLARPLVKTHSKQPYVSLSSHKVFQNKVNELRLKNNCACTLRKLKQVLRRMKCKKGCSHQQYKDIFNDYMQP